MLLRARRRGIGISCHRKTTQLDNLGNADADHSQRALRHCTSEPRWVPRAPPNRQCRCCKRCCNRRRALYWPLRGERRCCRLSKSRRSFVFEVGAPLGSPGGRSGSSTKSGSWPLALRRRATWVALSRDNMYRLNLAMLGHHLSVARAMACFFRDVEAARGVPTAVWHLHCHTAAPALTPRTPRDDR